MGGKFQYRIAIAKGPMSANQLNEEFGKDGWELADVVKWPHEGEERLWHYFRRFVAEPAQVLELTSSTEKGSDKAVGTDEIGVDKNASPKTKKKGPKR